MANTITLSGRICEKPVFSHKCNGESLYKFSIETMRKSGTADIINCIIPETMVAEVMESERTEVCGEVRSRNDNSTGRSRLQIYVFVKSVSEYEGCDKNLVMIDGFYCKEAVLKVTPLGRQIAELLIASNRGNFGASDYIPCLCWGRNAVRAQWYPVGTNIIGNGRLQSRPYTKKNEDGEEEIRITFELSLGRIEAVMEEE